MLRNNRHPRCASALGFTLIEVIVALAVMAIGLVTLLNLQLVSIRMTHHAYAKSQAALLAEARMAEAIANGFPEIGSMTGTVEDADRAIAFDWQTTVSDLHVAAFQDTAVSGLRRVEVVVTWEAGQSLERVSMSTCVSDKRRP